VVVVPAETLAGVIEVAIDGALVVGVTVGAATGEAVASCVIGALVGVTVGAATGEAVASCVIGALVDAGHVSVLVPKPSPPAHPAEILEHDVHPVEHPDPKKLPPHSADHDQLKVVLNPLDESVIVRCRLL
jgi:hypothetical protein